MKNKIKRDLIKVFFVLLIIALPISIIFNIDQAMNLNLYREKDYKKQNQIESLEKNISEYKNEVSEYQNTIFNLQDELGYQKQLTEDWKNTAKETQNVLDLTIPFKERVEQGWNKKEAWKLLSQYNEVTKDIINSKIGMTGNIWQDSKNIYEWIGNNYLYCGDKGLKVGDQFVIFQYWSPDEMLAENFEMCGDCDDHAFLFAGMLYAMGYNDEEVNVYCGIGSIAGHCWNTVKVEGIRYLVDPTCSNVVEASTFLGIPIGVKDSYPFPNTPSVVGCHSKYEGLDILTSSGYQEA